MSFLSLAFLAALPLAAAPILLHWFDRHRNVTIEWGAMQFLVEAAQHRTRARRLQEWWLLAMRVLAIACLVLALARPLAQTTWLSTPDQQETIVILDNSLSMQRRVGEGTAFELAVSKARQHLGGLATGHTWRVLTTAPYPNWVSIVDDNGATTAASVTASDDWGNLRATLAQGDLLGALMTAIQAEPAAQVTRRRIVILTDGQALDWQDDETEAWEQLADALDRSSLGLSIEQIPVVTSQSSIRNLAIQRVTSQRTALGVQQPCTITALVENVGQVAMSACQLRWQEGDHVLCSQAIPALEPQATHTVTCKLQFPSAGLRRLTCTLDLTDELPADHHETLLLDVVDELPVLIVESAIDQADLQQDSLFVQAALGWIAGERVDDSSVFAPTIVDIDQLPRIELARYHAVIVPQVTMLPDAAVQQLQEYAREGGGVWLAVGPRTDLDRFNHQVFNAGQGLSPLPLDRILDETEDEERRVTLNPQLSSHPAVMVLADQRKLDTGDIEVTRRFRFVPPAEGHDVSVLLSQTQGEPVVIERQFGRGRVIVQGIPLRWEWSGLVRSEAFVVLLQEWLTYLTEPRLTQHNLSPGEPLSLTATETNTSQATLHLPTGDEVELTAEVIDHANHFRTSRTLLPGDYALEVGLSGDQIPFYVRRDTRESDLTPRSAEKSRRLMELFARHRTGTTEHATTTAAADPVWPVLWLLMILLMVGELWLSNRMSRQRFGTTSMADSMLNTAEVHPILTTITGRRGVSRPGLERQTKVPVRTKS